MRLTSAGATATAYEIQSTTATSPNQRRCCGPATLAVVMLLTTFGTCGANAARSAGISRGT